MAGMNKNVQGYPRLPLFIPCVRMGLEHLDNKIAFRWVLWRRARGKNTTVLAKKQCRAASVKSRKGAHTRLTACRMLCKGGTLFRPYLGAQGNELLAGEANAWGKGTTTL